MWKARKRRSSAKIFLALSLITILLASVVILRLTVGYRWFQSITSPVYTVPDKPIYKLIWNHKYEGRLVDVGAGSKLVNDLHLDWPYSQCEKKYEESGVGWATATFKGTASIKTDFHLKVQESDSEYAPNWQFIDTYNLGTVNNTVPTDKAGYVKILETTYFIHRFKFYVVVETTGVTNQEVGASFKTIYTGTNDWTTEYNYVKDKYVPELNKVSQVQDGDIWFALYLSENPVFVGSNWWAPAGVWLNWEEDSVTLNKASWSAINYSYADADILPTEKGAAFALCDANGNFLYNSPPSSGSRPTAVDSQKAATHWFKQVVYFKVHIIRMGPQFKATPQTGWGNMITGWSIHGENIGLKMNFITDFVSTQQVVYYIPEYKAPTTPPIDPELWKGYAERPTLSGVETFPWLILLILFVIMLGVILVIVLYLRLRRAAAPSVTVVTAGAAPVPPPQTGRRRSY